MKKITAFVFMLLIIICFSSVLAYANDITTVIFTVDRDTVTVNGVERKLDTPAAVIGGRTYVPVRGLAEALGGTAGWNAETRTVSLKCGSDEIRLTIDSIIAFLNGEEKDLDAPPLIVDGRTLLPARFIAEGFGYRVIWNNSRKTITVTNGSTEPVTEPITAQSFILPHTARVTEAVTELTTGAVREQLKDTFAPVINPDTPKSTTLVLYFSRTGNTQRIAEIIGSIKGADVVRLETVLPYPSDYNMLLSMAQKEKTEGARPTVKTSIKNLAYYDTIYIGYPIWYETMPMAMFTFLENNDLSGKTVIPFCTHSGSGLGRSVEDIRAILPDSDIKDGFACDSAVTEQEIKNLIGNY